MVRQKAIVMAVYATSASEPSGEGERFLPASRADWLLAFASFIQSPLRANLLSSALNSLAKPRRTRDESLVVEWWVLVERGESPNGFAVVLVEGAASPISTRGGVRRHGRIKEQSLFLRHNRGALHLDLFLD